VKRLRNRNQLLDPVDVALLRALHADARTTMTDLARAVGLSAPSAAERVRRLEEAGVVRGYAARIDPAALGLALSAYIRVRPMPGQLRNVAEVLQAIEAVVACDRVTGEDCYVVKVHTASLAALETVIDQITPYAMTNTSIIQSSPIDERLPPLAGPASANGRAR
jgi:Lrp/AsnC family transcriptional regulator, leucine-responsive regulatory protein